MRDESLFGPIVVWKCHIAKNNNNTKTEGLGKMKKKWQSKR